MKEGEGNLKEGEGGEEGKGDGPKHLKTLERQQLESQPIFKARKWLKDIVATMTSVRESAKESEDMKVKKLAPNALQSEFSSLFKTRTDALVSLRKNVEDLVVHAPQVLPSRRRGRRRCRAGSL